MSTLLIRNVGVITEDAVLNQYSVFCVDGKIGRVIPSNQDGDLTADEILDGSGHFLGAGFIDLHMHGVRKMLIDNGREETGKICGILPRYGVTGFLPTL